MKLLQSELTCADKKFCLIRDVSSACVAVEGQREFNTVKT